MLEIQSYLTCDTPKKRIGCSIAALVAAIAIATLFDSLLNFIAGGTSESSRFNLYRIAFIATCIFCFSCFFIYRHQAQFEPEKILCPIILSISLVFAFSISVCRISWDIESHFDFMLEWAKPIPGMTYTAAEYLITHPSDITSDFTIKAISESETKLNTLDGVDTGIDIDHDPSDLIKRVSSLPGSLIYMLGTIVGLSFTAKYICAHLVYVFINAAAIYFGMRRLKQGKMLYAVIASFPTVVFIASNYSYDYWVTCVSMLGFAYLIGELQRPDELLNRKNAVIMLTCFLIAFLPKAIYFPLVLSCLLIGSNKFKSAKSLRRFRLLVLLIFLLLIATFLLPMIINSPGSGDSRGGDGVNSTNQIIYIASNPLEFIKTLGLFMLSYLSVENTRGYIGFFAYLGFTPTITWIISLTLLTVTAVTDGGILSSHKSAIKQLLFVDVIALISAALVCIALYISFTAVGSSTIEGCQPRYLIPLVFPALYFTGLVFKRFKQTEPSAIYNIAILGATTASLLFATGATYMIYLV